MKKQYRKPKRIFETSGLVNPSTSYYVPLENVTNTRKEDIKTMIDMGRYFSIFAPRQSGKTTFFKETCKQLHKDPTYVAITLSFQDYKDLDKTRFYQLIEQALYEKLIDRLKEVKCEKTPAVQELLNGHRLTDHISFRMLFVKLNRLIQFKKIVIFIDEFDGSPEEELENFLNALRSLYQDYKDVKQKALYSIGLVGIRNITKLVVGGVSPFNIADQVELPPFSLQHIHDLFVQYTAETNQPFTAGAIQEIYQETAGQPWLVNRLATILTKDVKYATTEPIDEQDVDKSLRILLSERNDHFNNLYEKAKQYKETFIEIVFDHVKYMPDDEDQSWLEQYGLIKNSGGHAIVANPIYKSRYTATFFKEVQAIEDIQPEGYELPGGKLDMENILLDFEQYIAQVGVNAFYKEKKPYEKTGHFLLTAWLYQFVRGGAGELRFELRTGLGRTDVLLTYKKVKYIIETKLNKQNLGRTVEQALKQIQKKYMAPENVDEGYLVIFDIKPPIGQSCEPEVHHLGEKKISSFVIGIQKED